MHGEANNRDKPRKVLAASNGDQVCHICITAERVTH